MTAKSTDLEKLWNTIKKQLKLQMTQATFTIWLKDTRLASIDNGCWQVIVKNDAAKAWLKNRLYETIKRTVASHVGQPVELEFVIEGKSPRVSTPNSLMAHNPQDIQFVQSLDFKALFFEPGGSGYERLAKYWSRFWRVYLNQMNNQAYSLWEFLQHPDMSDQTQAPYWTPARKYNARPLARQLHCSPVMLTGGFRQCSVFDAALDEGQELTDCCRLHQPSEMRTNKYYQPQCRYWRTGAFEILYQEGLLAINVTGQTSKSKKHHLQVWRILPLLTPWQVERLPEADQEIHNGWLTTQAGKGLVNEAWWYEYTGRRMVEHMAERETGRHVQGHYRPNPLLLDSVESNNAVQPSLFDSNEPLPLDSTESNGKVQPSLFDSIGLRGVQ